MSEKVAVAMSGGVDSSVTAAILKRDGYEVFGITMKLSDEPVDLGGAKRIAEQLGIKHYSLDLREEFSEEVIAYFCESYEKGITPNPCIVCNHTIKFGILLKKVKELGASKLATGHYARIERAENAYKLRKGVDSNKDQSYFLYRLDQQKLRDLLFPLGKMNKQDVYKTARLLGFPLKDERESQDICFINDKKSQEFIEKNTNYKKGDIVDEHGNVLGTHSGLPFYTIGQRKGMGISSEEPLYVVDIDSANNRITVGGNKALYKNSFKVSNINWVSGEKPPEEDVISVKIRYRSPEAEASLRYGEDDMEVILKEKQRAITPGQSAVFYKGEEVLGGGIIMRDVT